MRKPETERSPATRAPRHAEGTLRIGAVDDAFEREADRVADAIMAPGRSGPQWSFSGMAVTPRLQPKCACGGSGGAEGECEECKEKKAMQRKASGDAEISKAPPIVNEVLRSPGQPLDQLTRAFFESRFGHDFGGVRIHHDARAAASARAVNANAYTIGNHIAFAGGHYAPATGAGRSLLAHELAHTVQQSGGAAGGVVQRQETQESTGPKGLLGKAKYLLQDVKNVGTLSKWKNAKECLTSLFPAMTSITFDRWIATACARTKGTLYSREWDAFGHCWIGCEGTRQCGGPQTFILGLGREVSREWESRTGGAPHDSLSQDLSNQTIGRVGSVKEGTCFSICDDLHKSGLLNLTAPKRTCVDCANQGAGETPCADADKPEGSE
jgi:hypothetical protein